MTSLPLRVYRFVRVGVHIAEGLATTALVFPWIAPASRNRLIKRWSGQLLRILRVELRLYDSPAGGLPGNLLLVANHVSWLDPFVMLALQPARFIAKAEIVRWPVIGKLASSVGTLFIDRNRRHDAHKVNQRAVEALAHGDVIGVFPEATTSDGRGVLPFHGSLLQPIVDAEGHVQPIAIRYRTAVGARSDAPTFFGEITFVESFWRVTGARKLVAELRFAPPIDARGTKRRELARDAEEAIRALLAGAPTQALSTTPAAGSAPGTRGRRPA